MDHSHHAQTHCTTNWPCCHLRTISFCSCGRCSRSTVNRFGEDRGRQASECRIYSLGRSSLRCDELHRTTPFAKNTAHGCDGQATARISENAFVTTSLCSPSRASILTGLYTFRHRVIDNQRSWFPRAPSFFPQYLQKAGYTTGFIGKWHMGHASDDPRPGFDYWVSFKGQGQYYPPNDKYTINDNGKRVPQDGYITTLLTRRAIEFLQRQTDRGKPFLPLSVP